jgi:hypothetical protein
MIGDFERDCFHLTFIIVHCNNHSILLLVTVVNLDLIVKLNFFVGMYMEEKTMVVSVIHWGS